MANKHVKSGLGHSLSLRLSLWGGLVPQAECCPSAWTPQLRCLSSALGAAVATGAGPCCSLAGKGAITSSGVVSGPLALGREAPPWPKTLPAGAWLAHGFVQGSVWRADRLSGRGSQSQRLLWVKGRVARTT